MPQLKLSFYCPSIEPLHRLAEIELGNIPTALRGDVKTALHFLSCDVEPRGSCPSRGPVRCVEVCGESMFVYVFYAQMPARRRVIVLHVTGTTALGPPEDGYTLAQCRLDDIPV